MKTAQELVERGLYRQFHFNELDERLRSSGFYAEELIPENKVPTALRRLAKDFNQLDFGKGFVLVPAREVILPIFEGNHYVFYRDLSFLLNDTKE